jgi:hypothetical protein
MDNPSPARAGHRPNEAKKLLADLPSNPEDFLTDEDRAEFAEWAERNHRRKTRIAMETGVDRVG